MIDTGIITIQKIVSHPFTRRMNTGSPWMLAQRDLMTLIASPRSLVRGRGNSAFAAVLAFAASPSRRSGSRRLRSADGSLGEGEGCIVPRLVQAELIPTGQLEGGHESPPLVLDG